MAKRINGQEVELEQTVWACEYKPLDDEGNEEDESWIVECDDEGQAHIYAQMLGGKVVMRLVFTTAYADAPDD